MRIMPPYTLKWLHGEYEQNEISALIRENYHQVYRASISRCLPWLLGLYDANGELQAASGVQIASHGALYLENYLDNPDGIDPNYFYGDYLLKEKKTDEARRYLTKALTAPNRPGREIADSGRRRDIARDLESIQ